MNDRAKRYPERIRWFTVDVKNGTTLIEATDGCSASIECSTDVQAIRKLYRPLLLVKKPGYPQ